jgi:FkbM family methyltransferase
VDVIRRVARSISTLAGHDSELVATMRPAYQHWLVWSTSRRGLSQTVNGRERFRIDPRYRAQFPETYDAPVCAYLRERVRPGSTCLNVGAHVGVYALCLSAWSGTSGRVYAFEPNPATRRVLETHVRLNGCEDRVRVVPAAVSDTPGRETLFAAADCFSGISRLGCPNPVVPGAPTAAVQVPVTTIDAFCRDTGVAPDWIVMDIEGYEIRALRGALETLRRGRLRLGIVVEMHPNLWPASGTSRAELDDLLRAAALSPVPLGGQRDPLGEHGMVRLEYAA